MEDLHEMFTIFKKWFPTVHEAQETLGKVIHDNAGATEEEIKQSPLMISQTTGFPTFMEAYSAYYKMR